VVAVAVKVRKVLKAQSVPQVRKGLLAVQDQRVQLEVPALLAQQV
jgi:hypothetical protein